MRLDQIQSSFHAAIVKADSAAIAGLIRADGIAPTARVQLHRNDYLVTLAQALADTYPVTRRLVGGDFFAAAAEAYVVRTPPRGPCLFEYGGGFPYLLATLPGVRPYPWLRDVARFEWAINAAYHALDRDPIRPEALALIPAASLAGATLDLHPSCRLLKFDYAVADIWRGGRENGDELHPVNLSASATRLLVYRAGIDVVWRPLSAGEFTFAQCLADGRSLGSAAERTQATGDPGFDLARLLTDLVADGIVTGIAALAQKERP